MTRRRVAGGSTHVVVAGLGSVYRHDDGVGAQVSERAAHLSGARDIGPVGDPLALLGRWDGAALAVVVDAVQAGAKPGTIRVADLTGYGDDSPAVAVDNRSSCLRAGRPGAVRGAQSTSSHGIDLLGVLRLARAVEMAPAQVVLVGIEGADFSPGTGLSSAVSASVPRAIGIVVALVRSVEGDRSCA